jgi:hypothetical protein
VPNRGIAQMVRLHSILILCALAVTSVAGQPDSAATSFYQDSKMSFAVPDIPAFKLLGTDPSEILRPTTAKSLTMATSSVLSPTGVVLPRGMAVEVAPYTLFNSGGLSLQDYAENRFFYSCRVSLGTASGSAGDSTSKLAVGLHFTPIDDGDLRNDAGYQDTILVIAKSIEARRWKHNDMWDTRHGRNPNSALTNPESLALRTADVNAEIKSEFADTLVHVRDSFLARNWNKQRLDFALGWLQVSPDTLTADARTSQLSGWASYCVPAGKTGQVQAGATISYHVGPTSYVEGAVALRFYKGINQLKCFGEGQYQYSGLSCQGSALLDGGADIRLSNAVWLDLGVGIEFPDANSPGSQPKLTSKFDFKFTTPQSLGLF